MLSKNMNNLKRVLRPLSESLKFSSVPAGKPSVWTDENIVKSPFEKIQIPNCTLYDYVWQNLEKWPERTCTVCSETGRGYTYEQTFNLSNAFGANLRKKFNIRDGNTVAIMLPNVPDYPIVTMGILEAGGVITTINPIYTPHEVSRQLLLSDSKVIVTLPELTTIVKESLKMIKLDIPIIVIKTNGEPTPEGTVVFNELSEDFSIDKSCLKEVRRNMNDICFLPYSSGTTGLPKGVELSNRNLVSNCEQINEEIIRSHNETTPTHQDVVLAVLPFFHIYAATVIMFHKMSCGIKIATLSKFHPDSFMKALVKTKTNKLYAAPPLILMMASHPSASPETYQYLETIINGAAPLADTDGLRLLQKAGRSLDFRQGYGLTETSPVVSMTPRGSRDYSGVGIPIPNTDVKIVDDQMTTLGSNQLGELLVRGPQVMQGYRNNPQANSEVFTDGWFRTGDLAEITEDGIITIKDRLKELIKVKGYQVPPAELEAVIREHPAVTDVAVIGIPHPVNGEAPKAFVVLKPGQKTDPQSIKDFVEDKVAPFKRIKEVMFLESIPKTSSGKILRKTLRENFS